MRLADVQFSIRGRLVVASLTGEIDLSNAEHISAAITEAMPRQSDVLVLDLSAVDYLDSAGIQLIYQLGEKLRTRNQLLRLVIPSAAPAYDALRLAGVSHHVEMIEALDDALHDPPDAALTGTLTSTPPDAS